MGGIEVSVGGVVGVSEETGVLGRGGGFVWVGTTGWAGAHAASKKLLVSVKIKNLVFIKLTSLRNIGVDCMLALLPIIIADKLSYGGGEDCFLLQKPVR